MRRDDPRASPSTSRSLIDVSSLPSVKGKLLTLEEKVRELSIEILFHKKETTTLKTEKETLENVFSMQVLATRKSLTDENNRIIKDMKLRFAQEKKQRNEFQQEINELRGENTAMKQTLLALQQRVAQLEMQVGQNVV